TVNQQTRRGKTTTPKGRTRRTVPMTATLLAALKALDTIRTGFVIRNDGSQRNDNETKYHCYRICRAAGLPERGWHTLRHAYGTHAAMFGANPWKLMQWGTSVWTRRCCTSTSPKPHAPGARPDPEGAARP